MDRLSRQPMRAIKLKKAAGHSASLIMEAIPMSKHVRFAVCDG